VLNDPNDPDGNSEQFAAISEQFFSVPEQSFYIWCFTLKSNLSRRWRQGERSSIWKS